VPRRLWSLSVVLALALLRGALGVSADDAARIDAPAGGERVRGVVEIRGRAVGPDPSRFSFYRLHYGPGQSPSTFRQIGPAGDQPVEDGRLGVWDTSAVSPGEYLIQLTVYDTDGRTTTAGVAVVVEATPTPTRPINRPPPVFATPGDTPTPGPEPEATATPLPELPPPDSPIQPSDAPPPAPPPPAPVPDVAPPPPPSGPPPVQIDPIGPAGPPPPPASVPLGPDPFTPPTPPPFDPGPAPPTIFVPGPPPPPVIQPFEPPAPATPLPLPTPLGL
jgi:hypothetical protein